MIKPKKKKKKLLNLKKLPKLKQKRLVKKAQRFLRNLEQYRVQTADTESTVVSQKMKRKRFTARYKVYTRFINKKNFECHVIVPSNQCFCGHWYKQHNYLNPKNKQVICKAKNCDCPGYSYLPVFGFNDIKCLCKHSYQAHDNLTQKCREPNCGGCKKFRIDWNCQKCGLNFASHKTVNQTRQERIARGYTVDKIGGLDQEEYKEAQVQLMLLKEATGDVVEDFNLLDAMKPSLGLKRKLEIQKLEEAKEHEEKLAQTLLESNKRLEEKAAKHRLARINKQIADDVKYYDILDKQNGVVQRRFSQESDSEPEISAYELFIRPHNYLKQDVIQAVMVSKEIYQDIFNEPNDS